jgi:energy-coupling factor transporter ATP-binding protein EcfA2
MTLIFGRNQAGKSTLLRLLPILSDAIFGAVPVFDGTSPALMNATFKELGWLGPMPSASPLIKLEGDNSHPFFEIQLTDDRGIVPNRVRVGTGTNEYLDILLAGDFVRSTTSFSAPYAGRVGKASDWRGDVEFSSMLPSGITPIATKRIAAVRDAFKHLERVQWLAASRSGMVEGLRPSRCCRPDGLDLPNILADRKDVIELASNWLSASALGEAISIGKDPSGTYRIELRRAGNESLPNHLAGEGAQWMLPILLSACWAELGGGGGPSMLAIEEPESRLHPNLQLALFDRLLDTVRTGIPCILETHSIYLLRRAQLAVVKQQISPDDLAIYWVERNGHAATVRQIEVQPDGTLLGWNPETFEEEQQLSREIFEARWKGQI